MLRGRCHWRRPGQATPSSGSITAGVRSTRGLRRARSTTVAPAAFTHTGAGDESKCPVARLVNFGRQKLSHNTYDYAPFTHADYQGKYRMGMGLAPMKGENWIEIDDQYEEEMALRRTLLAEKRDIVLQTTPQAEEANRELLELLAAYLPRVYPDRFELTPGNELRNLATGDAFDLEDPTLDPLETAALLVQEDLCLMVPDAAGELRFVSGAVLFPQRWSLAEKVGMNMQRIHAPVPLFEREIQRPVAAFLDRLEPARPFWRCNWTITDNPQLFQPLVEEDIEAVNAGVVINGQWTEEPVTVDNAGTRLRTRMERETFSRFPRTRAVLFTIRTHMRPLADFERKPDQARLLANAVRNLHPAVAQYKTIAAFREQALAYLDRVAATAESPATVAA